MSERKHAVERFKNQLTLVMTQHQELMGVVKNNRNQVSLETMLVEQFSMSMAVSWEAFLNDLILQYVKEQPGRFLSDLNSRVRKSVRDKFGVAAANRLKIVPPKKLTRESAQALIDHKGENIPTTSADILATKASDFLPAAYAKKFSLNSSDRCFFDFVFALRNYLGHRSPRAWLTLKKAIGALDIKGVDKPLATKITKVGVYLRSRIGMETRATFIAKRLMGIAEILK